MSSTNARPRRVRKRLIALSAWLIGALFLLFGLLSSAVAINLDVTGTRTTATILDQRASGRHESYLVSFPLPDGTPLQTWTGAVDDGQNGDKVPVVYDAANPLGTVASPSYETTQEWMPLLTAVAVAGGLFAFGRAKWRQSRRANVTFPAIPPQLLNPEPTPPR